MIAHKGIAHLTALVGWGIVTADAVKKANSDGHIGLGDIWTLWPAIKGAPEAFKDPGELPLELADLDAVEAEQLVQQVEAHFSEILPPGRRTQDIVDAWLGVLPQLANAMQTTINPPPKAQPA